MLLVQCFISYFIVIALQRKTSSLQNFAEFQHFSQNRILSQYVNENVIDLMFFEMATMQPFKKVSHFLNMGKNGLPDDLKIVRKPGFLYVMLY